MITHPTLNMQVIAQHQAEARREAAQDRLARHVRAVRRPRRPRLPRASVGTIASLLMALRAASEQALK
jgi:hypothetical protein